MPQNQGWVFDFRLNTTGYYNIQVTMIRWLWSIIVIGVIYNFRFCFIYKLKMKALAFFVLFFVGTSQLH